MHIEMTYLCYKRCILPFLESSKVLYSSQYESSIIELCIIIQFLYFSLTPSGHRFPLLPATLFFKPQSQSCSNSTGKWRMPTLGLVLCFCISITGYPSFYLNITKYLKPVYTFDFYVPS